jgi:AraC family transcriptional regulator, regulatory protein of adaptative response / DNA-3-methyladenine glycosylase II
MINWRSAPCNGRTHFPTTANPNRCNALTRTNTDNKQASDWALDVVDGTNHFTMLKVNSFFGADIETIDAHLSLDPLLAPFVAQRPGLRAPGGWDGFELGVRAILGQQVTVAAARLLAGQLVASHGERVSSDFVIDPRLTHVFPEARIALAESIDVGMPAARRSALKELAAAAVADPNLFRSFGTIEEAIARFRKIRGVGEWTAQYIALRALRETDASPAADIGLLRGAEVVDGTRSTVPNLLLRSESWRLTTSESKPEQHWPKVLR